MSWAEPEMLFHFVAKIRRKNKKRTSLPRKKLSWPKITSRSTGKRGRISMCEPSLSPSLRQPWTHPWTWRPARSTTAALSSPGNHRWRRSITTCSRTNQSTAAAKYVANAQHLIYLCRQHTLQHPLAKCVHAAFSSSIFKMWDCAHILR